MTAENESNSPDSDVQPIHSDELIYRRVPEMWFREKDSPPVSLYCLVPRKWKSDHEPGDKDGLSVDRASLTTLENACISIATGKQSIVIQFKVADAHPLGLSVIADPIGNVDIPNPAHALVPELNSLALKQNGSRIKELAASLRDYCKVVFMPPEKLS